MAEPIPPAFPSSDPDALREISRGIASTCAGFNLRRASRAVTQHFDHALADVGIRSTQFTILSALALAGWITTHELAQGLVMDRTTLTRNLKLLRSEGLIVARPAEGSRQIQFGLNGDGRALLARAIPRWRTAQDSIVRAYGDAEWPGMVQELGRLVLGALSLSDDAAALSAAQDAQRRFHAPSNAESPT